MRASWKPVASRGAARREALLGSYVAPIVVSHILSDGRTPLPSGVRLPITVLFGDIRGFTRLSERLAAERVVAMLDEYFDAMSAAAIANGAMIDKLIGDAIMLLYGVPTARGDEATRAMVTAHQMHRRFEKLARTWTRVVPAGTTIGLGIGAASGDVVLANVGSPARMDYTVIGMPVNVAARLASAAPAGITLVSASLRQALEREGYSAIRYGGARRLGLHGLRGRQLAFACEIRGAVRVRTSRHQVEDPVCGMKVQTDHALIVRRGGRRYYFCSPACRSTFIRAPGRYISQEAARRRWR